MLSAFRIALAFSLLQMAFGQRTPLLEKRGTCNADNCLRGLQANGASASSFCSAYLGGTASTTTVAYTSVCTENPTAVSTACSCLLTSSKTTTTSPTTITSTTTSKTTSTTTTTTTTSTTTPTPTSTSLPQCAASKNYGYVYTEDAYDSDSAILYFSFPDITARGQCCNLCYSTTGCYGFTEGSDGSGYYYCELARITQNLPYGQPTGPNVSQTCPQGQYYWQQADLAPYVPGSTGGSGQGPCGIF